MHKKGGTPVPHLLTSLLTQVAVAVIEALVIRLLAQLWNAFARSGRPMAAAA
ncbi:hypothetical protein [Streptomyces sp. NPDC001312]|uniref:hypothetical protein n=1 Tax=Streptomyces sp. NPDC001312 TaxID=3364561 RepID=UPI0036B3DD90